MYFDILNQQSQQSQQQQQNREKKQNPYWSSLIDKIIILELLLKMKNQFHKQNETKQKNDMPKNPNTIDRIDAFTNDYF